MLCIDFPLGTTGSVWYTFSMAIESVLIERKARDGRYAEVLDAAGYLAARDYGSTVNAICVMCERSPLFAEAMEAIRLGKARADPEAS